MRGSEENEPFVGKKLKTQGKVYIHFLEHFEKGLLNCHIMMSCLHFAKQMPRLALGQSERCTFELVDCIE